MEASIGFGKLVGVTGSHRSLLPEGREMTPFVRWEPVSRVPVECWLLSNFRNTPIVQDELAHFWIYEQTFGGWEIGVSFGLDSYEIFISGSAKEIWESNNGS